MYLVVDDDPLSLRVASRMLARHGETYAASSVAEAFEVAAEREVYGFLVDYRLGAEIDGLGLLGALAGVAPFATGVLMTGEPDEALGNRAYARGFAMWTKPFGAHEVEKLVRLAERSRAESPRGQADRFEALIASAPLTPKLVRVVELALEGYSRDAIAKAMDIRPGTLKGYVETVLDRTGHPTLEAVVAHLRRPPG